MVRSQFVGAGIVYIRVTYDALSSAPYRSALKCEAAEPAILQSVSLHPYLEARGTLCSNELDMNDWVPLEKVMKDLCQKHKKCSHLVRFSTIMRDSGTSHCRLHSCIWTL